MDEMSKANIRIYERAEGENIMEIKKKYTVWYWGYRIGRTFKSKKKHDEFIQSLQKGQHIGTTVKIHIIDDDVA